MQFGGNSTTNGHKLKLRVHTIWSSYECYYPQIVWAVIVNYMLDWTRLYICVKDVCIA